MDGSKRFYQGHDCDLNQGKVLSEKKKSILLYIRRIFGILYFLIAVLEKN